MMTKDSFLEKLAFELKGLPWEEIQRHRAYYEEMLDDMLEDGMTQEEATEKLGDPAVLAAQIRKEPGVHSVMQEPQAVPVKSANTKGNRDVWTVVAIVAAVLTAPIWGPVVLSLLSLVLSAYLTLWGIVLAVYAVTLAMLAGGIGLLIVGFLNLISSPWAALTALGGGLFLLALFCLCILLSWAVTLGMVRGTKWCFCACSNGIRKVRGK